jgi:tRNA (mo5U34)-methyltransferase
MTLEAPRRRALLRRGVAREIARLGPWFHNLHLPSGDQTAPGHPLGDFPAYKWRELAPHLPTDLRGWRALDIGCNAGFYSFELARLGASVVAIDKDEHYLRQARWAAGQLGLEEAVRFERLEVYELATRAETFDLVLFLGVLYHLRHPLLALDLVAEKVERLLVVQTLTVPGPDEAAEWRDVPFDRRELLATPAWPKLAFVEQRLAGDPTNWWVPNKSCVEAMLRSSGLELLARPGHELWLCRRRRLEPGARQRLTDELDAATGRRGDQRRRLHTFGFGTSVRK